MALVITHEQYKKLDALAFWVQELTWTKEHEPNDSEFITKAHKTISFIFEQLDKLKTPFMAQNITVSIGEDWTRYSSDHFSFLLRDAGILVEDVTYFKEG